MPLLKLLTLFSIYESKKYGVIALHLEQNILSDNKWFNYMTPDDFRALTPLVYMHVNPYGTFRLNMNERLLLESEEAKLTQNLSPHKLRHFLLTWLKKQGIDDALIQPYSGHESRKSLEIYSKLAITDAQHEYNEAIYKFPI